MISATPGLVRVPGTGNRVRMDATTSAQKRCYPFQCLAEQNSTCRVQNVRAGWDLFLVDKVKCKNLWFLLSKKQQLGLCGPKNMRERLAPLLPGSTLPGSRSVRARGQF